TGSKQGCDKGDCGACTVLARPRGGDGRGEAILSCITLAQDAQDLAITTSEGLAGPQGLDPVQRAFADCGALQCGFFQPGMLHGKSLRSPDANTRIRSIDVRAAEKYPGVVATLVGAGMLAKYGVIPWTHDEQARAVDHARFVGVEVACVAAVDERTAEEALQLVRVDYEPMPAVLSVEDALAHPEIKVNERAKVGNVTKHVELEFGPVDEALA